MCPTLGPTSLLKNVHTLGSTFIWCHVMNTYLRYLYALTILFITSVCVSGCTAVSYFTAMLKSTDQFLSSPTDPRVKYESGAEAQALIISKALPISIHTVEQAQYRQFVAPVTVYICSTLESFTSYTTNSRAGGVVLNSRLFISPKPENTAERLPRLLTHELSHLQIQQQLGSFKSTRIPSWFMEGLAVVVADGAGAEKVSENQARDAIQQGKQFYPETEGSLLPKTAHDYGLDPHLYYREASMFIAYLLHLDEQKFKVLLLTVEDGKSFAGAFQSAYNTTIDETWQQFIVEINKTYKLSQSISQ